jgi:short-subunit dehydrogenase
LTPKGATALVTGGSSGIGAAYADRLAQRGYALVLVARNEQRLENVAGRLRGEYGVPVDVLPADLTDRTGLARVEARLDGDERIAMLVNNAGATMRSAVVGTPLDQLDGLIALNLVAVTHLATVAAGAFVRRGGGTIVNVSSMVVVAPETYRGIYGATKAFVLNFSLTLHGEVAERGVRVQVLVPGTVRTEIFARAGKDISTIDPGSIMEPRDLVDAALAGLDRGEIVTIPSLQRAQSWDELTAARLALLPELSRDRPAERYLRAPVRSIE